MAKSKDCLIQMLMILLNQEDRIGLPLTAPGSRTSILRSAFPLKALLHDSRFIRLIPIRHQTASTVCARTVMVASGREQILDYFILTRRKTDLFAHSGT